MNPEYLTDPALATRHGFFTRRGGVSEGPYASLNASLSGGDDLARVMATGRWWPRPWAPANWSGSSRSTAR